VVRLLLLRHGQSSWNAEGRWQGHADPPLTGLGELQAAAAARRIAAVASSSGTVGRVLSSDLQRARRTAEVIAGALALPAVEIDRAFRERDVGAWSGLTGDEVELAFPGYQASGRRPPGWESDAELLARVLPAVIRIAQAAVDALVVTHGGILRALESHLGASDRSGGVANLSGRWLHVEGDRLSAGSLVLPPGG